MIIKGVTTNYTCHAGAASLHPFRKRPRLLALPGDKYSVVSVTKDAPTVPVPLEQALSELNKWKWNPATFLSVKADGSEIICPVNYINYGEGYVQVISGYVLWHDGEYRVGYVAVKINGASVHCELLLRRPVSALRIKTMGRVFSWAKMLPIHFLCMVDEFSERRVIHVDARLFRYAG